MNHEKPTPLKDELALKRQARADKLRSLGVLACDMDGQPAQVIPLPVRPDVPRIVA